MELNDKSPMPFGKHKNIEMANVPASYLMFIWESNLEKYKKSQVFSPVLEVVVYIEQNLDVIEEEIKNKKHDKMS